MIFLCPIDLHGSESTQNVKQTLHKHWTLNLKNQTQAKLYILSLLAKKKLCKKENLKFFFLLNISTTFFCNRQVCKYIAPICQSLQRYLQNIFFSFAHTQCTDEIVGEKAGILCCRVELYHC